MYHMYLTMEPSGCLALTLLVVLLCPTLQREGPTYARSMAEAFRACLLADLCLPIEHQQSTDYLGAYEDMAPREDTPNSAVATSVTRSGQLWQLAGLRVLLASGAYDRHHWLS